MPQPRQHHAGTVGDHDPQEGHTVDLAEAFDRRREDGEHDQADDHEREGDERIPLEFGVLVHPALEDHVGQVALLTHGGHQTGRAGVGRIHRSEKDEHGVEDQDREAHLASLDQRQA
ncbi:hypothetical protein D3C72_1775820 [compost metagenome]